jgi:hypothetical protein
VIADPTGWIEPPKGVPETSDDVCHRSMDWLHDVAEHLDETAAEIISETSSVATSRVPKTAQLRKRITTVDVDDVALPLYGRSPAAQLVQMLYEPRRGHRAGSSPAGAAAAPERTPTEQDGRRHRHDTPAMCSSAAHPVGAYNGPTRDVRHP